MAGSILGNAVRRVEDPDLLTGRGTYLANLRLAGLLHVAFVRSPTAHARVAGIEYPSLVRTICELGITRRRELQLQPDTWALAQQLSGMPAPAAPELELFSGRER